jgi:hypothetical protein
MDPSPSGLKVSFMKKKVVVIALAVVIVGGAFWLGQSIGYKSGYATAQADIKAIQTKAATKAASDAAKSANPFQAVNPLEGVDANPFEKVKKVLNPFEE